jgi:hypothetical protein
MFNNGGNNNHVIDNINQQLPTSVQQQLSPSIQQQQLHQIISSCM